jgi:hypothetical protein
METAEARSIAYLAHHHQTTRHGDPFTEHVERVAAAVPPEARAIAYLHDVLEHTGVGLDELVARGLSELELEALELLTVQPGESFELHALRVAHGPGPAGLLARTVRVADLDDHLRSRRVPGAPPYGWARQHVVVARDRRDGVQLRLLAAS